MMKEILDIANMYAEGLKNVEHRRALWVTKANEVRDHLKEVAKCLNDNAQYSPGYYVDVYHAFDEHINGTCLQMPSVAFRSGTIPMQLIFKNASLEVKEYNEKGFVISFNPTITGQVVVLLFAHHNDLQPEQQQAATLAVIDDLEELTMDAVDEIIAKGMQAAFYTSFAGVAEREEEGEGQPQQQHYTPIGFKRSETTEKVAQ